MKQAIRMIKRAVPRPIRDAVKRLVHRLRHPPIEPYLKHKNVEGVEFDFWIGDRDGRDWYDLQSTDPHWPEMRFLRDHVVVPGDVVLECGGHHGCTAIVLSRWVGAAGRVVTFEPLPSNARIIERNMRQNNLANVTLQQQAIGDANRTITISTESNASVLKSGRGVAVDMIRLDDFAHLAPTFVKIDVEGFELQVLQGAPKILATCPKLAIEVHTEQLAQYGASVQALLDVIGVERYHVWVQWDDDQAPVPYDAAVPIDKRVHLFLLPITAPASPA